MSEFTHEDLRRARESRKMTRLDLAIAVNVSDSTVERWERGKQEPFPNNVADIERALGIPGIWHKWMRSHSAKYREYYGEIKGCDNLSAALTQARYEISDVIEGISIVERDATDGRIDDPAAKARLRKELLDLGAAVQQVQDWLIYEENAHRRQPMSVMINEVHDKF